METSENRPENEVPEPPMPSAEQVSNDDRPEGSAEDEEKKEVNMQATCWGGWAGVGLGERVDALAIPLTQWDSLKKGLDGDLDQDRVKGEFAGLARETPCDGDRAHLFPFPGWRGSAVQSLGSL